MLDAIMQTSLPLWLLLSALFPVYLIGMVIKAAFHAKRIHVPRQTLSRNTGGNVWPDTEDWLPIP